MTDSTGRARVVFAGLHPLLLEDRRLQEGQDYDSVVVSAEEWTLLPAVDRLQPDIVCLDLLHATSLSTIRRIKAINPACRVVALTGMRRADIAESIFSAGASAVLYRHHAAAELADVFRVVLSGGSSLSRAFRKPSETTAGSTIEEQRRPSQLSAVDRLILYLMLKGYQPHRIARALGLSGRTVRLSMMSLIRRFGMRPAQVKKPGSTCDPASGAHWTFSAQAERAFIQAREQTLLNQDCP